MSNARDALEAFLDSFATEIAWERYEGLMERVIDEQEANQTFGLEGLSNDLTSRIGLEVALDFCHALKRVE